jgi:hypothetical protein
LPEKDGEFKPIFDYEMEIFKYFEKGKTDRNFKHFWIKKARGLGITEFFLRYMGWLAMYDDTFYGRRFVIITGIRVKTAWDLIRRMKNMFRDYVAIDTRLDNIILNGTMIEAFPSDTKAMRGYEDFAFIFLDEADFFEQANQEEVTSVVRGFIPKTQPWIAMVSTPNEPNSLFHRIEQMKSDEEAGYRRLQFLYERGLGKIYDPALIEEEKKQDHFPREYEGQYSFGVGNLFTETVIQQCEKLGRTLDIDQQQDIFRINPFTRKSMGIDVGWGSSNTAFVIVEYYNNKIRVIYSKQFKRPGFDEMVDHAYSLIRAYNPQKTFLDGSFPVFTRALKQSIGEEVDYISLIDLAKARGQSLLGYMDIVPVYFNQKQQDMLDHLKRVIDKQELAINPDRGDGFKELLSDIRIAKNKVDTLKLDKQINRMDLFDALRLSLEYYE